MAEREGFEPPEALTSTVFKTAAIDHSAISPIEHDRAGSRVLCAAKIRQLGQLHKPSEADI